jgi:hypothetical protein
MPAGRSHLLVERMTIFFSSADDEARPRPFFLLDVALCNTVQRFLRRRPSRHLVPKDAYPLIPRVPEFRFLTWMCQKIHPKSVRVGRIA